MGKILEYNDLGGPPNVNDLLFIGDYNESSTNPTTKHVSITNLNKKYQIWAADGGGLKITDDGGNYGLFIKDGGNVGIGTTSPASKLHIYSGVDGVPQLRLYGANADGIRISGFVNDAGNYAAVYAWDENDGGTASYADLYLGSTTTQGLFIKGSNGNVGVGVASPAANLDVAGDFRILHSTYGVAIDASNADIHGLKSSGSASGPLHLNRNAGEDIWFMYGDGTDFAGKIESTNKRWSIGAKSSAGARLHVYESSGADNVALQLENRVASGSPNSILRFTRTVGSTSLEQQMVWDGTNLGIRNVSAVTLGSDSVNFRAGSLDVGATGFTRKFNVTDSNNIVSEFNCSSPVGTRILIRNTADADASVQNSLIAFPNNIGGTEYANWMIGTHKDNSNPDNNYFMIHRSSQASPTAGQYIFNATTTANEMRLDTSGNVRFKGTMEASAYYDQGGNTAGNYCRGRFTQTFSFPYYFETTNQRWSPLLAAPYDTTNNYHGTDAPTKQYASLAPMGGRITRIDVSLYMSSASNVVKAYVFTGSSMPAGNALTTSDSAYKTDIDVSSANSNSFTLGFDDFAATPSSGGQANLDFSQGEFLMLAMDTNTGDGKCNVTVTVEFDVPDNLGA